MGVLDTGRGLSLSLISNLASGSIAEFNAAIPAKAKASNRLPSSEIANRSRMTCQAFSPGIMQRLSTSMHPDSRIPLSTTRPSSIDSGLDWGDRVPSCVLLRV